jgi:hypothetical protein
MGGGLSGEKLRVTQEHLEDLQPDRQGPLLSYAWLAILDR